MLVSVDPGGGARYIPSGPRENGSRKQTGYGIV